jgi:hypothetical protein
MLASTQYAFAFCIEGCDHGVPAAHLKRVRRRARARSPQKVQPAPGRTGSSPVPFPTRFKASPGDCPWETLPISTKSPGTVPGDCPPGLSLGTVPGDGWGKPKMIPRGLRIVLPQVLKALEYALLICSIEMRMIIACGAVRP